MSQSEPQPCEGGPVQDDAARTGETAPQQKGQAPSAPQALPIEAACAPAPAPNGSQDSAPVAAWSWKPQLRNNYLVMAVVAGAIAIFLVCHAADLLDNDIWFILATGREVVQHGIPYTNPFALHEGLGIVVQQWVPCVIAYGLYSLGGFVALGLWTLLLAGLLVLSLYRLGRLLKGDRFGGEWLLAAIALALPALMTYVSMRPHLYTMLAFTWLIYFCERYRRSGRMGWLVGCVALTAAHINFQMAMAPMDVAIVGCYWLPDLLAPLHRRGRCEKVQLADAAYKRWPLLVCMLACALALLANPYGLDGALYVAKSYGAAGYNGFILEMNPLAPWGLSGFGGMAAVVMLVLAALAAGKRGLGRIDAPLTLLAFGVGLMAFSHVRNVWLIALFALPLAMSVMHGWSMDFSQLWGRPPLFRRKKAAAVAADPWALGRRWQRWRNVALGATAVVCAGVAVAVVVLVWQAVPHWAGYEEESDKTATGLVDYIDQNEDDPASVRLFNPFNVGGYVEWRGYKAFMDPRPELWNSAMTGAETDYYNEYVDMMRGDWTDRDFKEFLERYDFDYLLVEKDTKLETYLKDFQSDYASLLGTGNYVLWGRK